MDSGIQIMEKPDWVSWETIHDVLWEAHAENRKNGVFMRYPSLSGEEIKRRIDDNGKMFVAIEDGKVIGSAALVYKTKTLWCGKGIYGYCCFASVLPSYQGRGVYKELCIQREQEARDNGIMKLIMDTNENNKKELSIIYQAGYKKVNYVFWKDHFNVVCVKWLDGCPFSQFRCWFEFHKQRCLVKMKHILKSFIKKRNEPQSRHHRA